MGIGDVLCGTSSSCTVRNPCPSENRAGYGLFLLSEKTKLYTNIQGGEARLLESYLQALPVHLKKGKKKIRRTYFLC